ncbi:uncharacterized protein LOC125369562 [Ricinus communis]|uniref:uncharacterized protein LOC125369562 n=1 Tax=Ricinus communis TaxID=3988 RepID=UPI00201B04BC|nr:uncharacterized protein LOC125369562 [Ricinus communis]
MDFIETFPYMIKYKKGKENVVADVLSRRYALLNTFNSKLLGFGFINKLYLNYDFGNVFNTCANGTAFNDFYVFDGYLYKKNRLCISSCSLHEILVKEAHGGSLIDHFRVHKTYDILIEHFFSPCMKRDMNKMYRSGSLKEDTEQAQSLIEDMAKNNYQWHTTRSRMGRQGSVHQLDATAALAAQVELLSKKLDQL